MPSTKATVGVIGGRDPREFGGLESVVRNIATHSGEQYEFIQYCTDEETYVEESDIGKIRAYSNSLAGIRSKYLSSLRASYHLQKEDIDIIHAHGDNTFGASIFRPTKPYIVTFHGTIAGMYENMFRNSGLVRKILTYIRPLPESVAARQCDIAVACSPKVRDELISYYSVDPAKIVVIPNGVDTKRFSPVPRNKARHRLGLSSDMSYALWVGTDPPRKGLNTAIDSVQMTDTEIQLLVAGIKGDSSETVRYLGHVPDDQMATLYSAVDVVLFPSLYEGFGLVLLEALSCGTPILASSAVAKLDTGVRYLTEQDPSKYALAIKQLLVNPPDQSELRQYALRYDWDRIVKKYTDIYRIITE